MSMQKICAGFETTLAAKLLAGGGTFSLTTHTNKKGAELDGEYGFIAGEGTATEEFLSGVILNGLVTILKRGLDPEDPDVEVPALKFDHDRGSSLKITDYPFLGFVKKYLGGEKGLPSPLKYETHQIPDEDTELVDKKFVQDSMSGSIGSATPLTAGTIRATQNQGANTRAMSTLVRAQDVPNMTLLVSPFKHAEGDKNISFAGGNSPAFIDPDLAGDLAIITNPANAETFVLTLNTTVCSFMFVSAIGAVPGNVLIGATPAITRANLVALINAPGVTTANGVAFTGTQLTALSLVTAIDDLVTSLFIKSVSTSLTILSAVETMAGVTNLWTVNTTKNRIDLLVLQTSDSTLQIRKGLEALSPVAVSPNSGDIVLAQVYLKIGMTHIDDASDGANGYILAWYFPQVYRTDMALPNFFGDGSDGNVIISVNTTLIRDMYYNNLTVNNGIILNSNGFKIFVKGDVNTIGTGKIASNGGYATDGTNGVGQVSGIGGVAGAVAYPAGGTLPSTLPGLPGGANSGGSSGGSVAKSLIGLGLLAAAGGKSGSSQSDVFMAGTNGGVAGVVSSNPFTKPYSIGSYCNLFDFISGVFTMFGNAPQSGSGGGGLTSGWGGGMGGAGGGGGSGATGGFVWIAAFNIINLNVESIGGKGGKGGEGTSSAHGGGSGGGGGGGNGGTILMFFHSKTTITYSVAGGLGGLAGTTYSAGVNGENGKDGLYKEIQF